jgi:hypothetical protein
MSFVNLRIVGIYARIPVSIFGPMPVATVADLLKAAKMSDPNFDYVLDTDTNTGDESLKTASYKWQTPPPTLSHKRRPNGLYLITENLDATKNGGVVTGWQYYIERPLASDPSYRDRKSVV